MFRADAIQITPEILGLIAKIDEFKGAWRALGTLAPDRLSTLQTAMAKALGLTAPRLIALRKGMIGLFSLDALVNVATRAGLSVRLLVKKAA